MKHRCATCRQIPPYRYYISWGLYSIPTFGLSWLQSLLIFLLLFGYSVAGYSQSKQSLKAEAFKQIEKAMEKPGKRIATTDTGYQKIWVNMNLENYNAKRLITKRELAVAIDQVLFPFYAFDVDFNGMPGKRKTAVQIMLQNATWMIGLGD